MASVWKHPESQYWTGCFRDQNGSQRRISTKETNNKKALKIAEEFERAARTKRTLEQVQKVLDRLHEEVSRERVVRATFRTYLNDWLTAKQADNAVSSMTFLSDESEQVFAVSRSASGRAAERDHDRSLPSFFGLPRRFT